MSRGVGLLMTLLLVDFCHAHLAANKWEYFPESYEKSREQFINSAKTIAENFEHSQSGHFGIASALDGDLTVNHIYIPASQKRRNLILITTGIHGLESYAGSAIIQLFIKEILPEVDLTNTGVLLYHSLNPYGFKYHRRVSENNVDLNRNSVQRGPSSLPRNQSYSNFNTFLNPKVPLDLDYFAKFKFYSQAFYFIGRYGMEASRQAILKGQYTFSKGLYFGGSKVEPLFSLLAASIARLSKDYGRVLHIDIHTGYGKKGVLHLLGKSSLPAATLKAVNAIFQGYTIDYDNDKDFYLVQGDLSQFIGSIFKNEIFIPMAFEFGTLNNSGTLGALDSLYRMISENQGAQWGYTDPAAKHKVKQLVRDMYNPLDDDWRAKVLEQSRIILPKVLAKFSQ